MTARQKVTWREDHMRYSQHPLLRLTVTLAAVPLVHRILVLGLHCLPSSWPSPPPCPPSPPPPPLYSPPCLPSPSPAVSVCVSASVSTSINAFVSAPVSEYAFAFAMPNSLSTPPPYCLPLHHHACAPPPAITPLRPHCSQPLCQLTNAPRVALASHCAAATPQPHLCAKSTRGACCRPWPATGRAHVDADGRRTLDDGLLFSPIFAPQK